jgi:hypothetical protein
MKVTDKDIYRKVWSFEYGWGYIYTINFRREYSVLVKFNSGVCREFNINGERVSGLNQSLFWNEIKFKKPTKPKGKKWTIQK